MKHLMILMSTYNGERYLAEQLDSLLLQDCEERVQTTFEILVRDDGSKDGTQKILQQYAERYPQKLRWYRGENCGVIRSFFALLEKAEGAEYYACCDQDDVWMPDKLSCAVQMLDKYNDEETPHLYCCRPKLVDEKLQELHSDIKRPPVRTGFGNALIENVVTGCTAVMNESLRRLITRKLPQFTVMHDRWFYLAASCFGTVDYDEMPHICYRQHETNAVGTSASRGRELALRMRLFWKKRRDISRQAEEFLHIFGDFMKKEELKKYAAKQQARQSISLARELVMAKHSFSKRVALVRGGQVFRQRKNDNRLFMLIILLGCY